ncbi:MAG: 4'-phosphopantetheinyl transferase superfamily protein [Salinivirgaceae bacterium]|nr:4'-phosphopantetheinyl transferase superfamily protein [Salinivirgaceae bacterium]
MPIVFKRQIDSFTQLAVWQLTETAHELLSTYKYDSSFVNDIKNEKRKCEKLAARILISSIIDAEPQITYELSGKPILNNYNGNVSITHSNSYISVIISTKHVGIDIETINERASKVRHKYLTNKELSWCNDNYKHTLVWSAKEAAYKIYGDDPEFAHYEVAEPKPIEQGATSIMINGKLGNKQYICHYELVGNDILVYIID